MVSWMISRAVVLLFGMLYPAYYSYKAVKTKNVKEYVRWMMYWIVFALYTVIETITDQTVAWFPLYYELKIAFVIWLLSPYTKGASLIYRKFLHPLLSSKEREIDDYIVQAKERGYETMVNFGRQGLNLAATAAVTAAVKMAAAEEEDSQPPRLSELFETSKQLLDEVEVTSEPTGSWIVQEKVRKGLELLDSAAKMLSQLDLFSKNEDLEEIPSTDLKYLLMPAFQGAFTMKQVNPSKRLEHLQSAREYFLKYLTQCQHYHVAEFELPQTTDDSVENNTASFSMAYPDLIAMASQRQAKIERYRQKKEVEYRLSTLKSAVESGQADDEHVREYYLLHLQKWISICLEELESIDQEIKILRERGDSTKEASTSRSSLQNRPPTKPFVLTRNVTQAKVLGAGYPSLASMTVNDWYEQRQKYGVLPDQGTPEFKRATQQQEDQEENTEDDEQTIHQAREWDDWKDTHPRGYGNRHNMEPRSNN